LNSLGHRLYLSCQEIFYIANSNLMLAPQTLLLALIFISLFASAQQKPNIVVILSDDHAYQAVGAYNNKLTKTPSIDRLAREGVTFDKAYVTNSICGPSRAVILTGKYSHKNGFKDNESSVFDVSQNTFIKELGKAGYQTAWIGKWHLVNNPKGFTFWQILPGQGEYYNPDFLYMDGTKKRTEGYATNIIEDFAEDWLNKRDAKKPFCLVVGHKAVHRQWFPDTLDMGRFDSTIFPLPKNFFDAYSTRPAAALQDMSIDKSMMLDYDLKMYDAADNKFRQAAVGRMNPKQQAKFDSYYRAVYEDFKKQNLSGRALIEWKYQRYMREYLSTAASLDRNTGRLLDYLDKNNLTQNTLVIYVSDQGFYLGEHGWFDKRWMYEESARTPMLMRYPGHVQPNTRNSNIALNLDIGPTLLNAAGVPVPSEMQGESFLPLVTNKKGAGRKAFYYHYYEKGTHSVSPHFGVSDGRYKLIRFYNKVNEWEFYDLKNDPSEMTNVYNNKAYAAQIKKSKNQLSQLIKKYEDSEAENILQSSENKTLPPNR